MRICFVVDARSPIAHNWIRHFVVRGHDVHVVSTYPCAPRVLGDVPVRVVPVGVAGLVHLQEPGRANGAGASLRPRLVAWLRSGLLRRASMAVQQGVAAALVRRQARALRSAVAEIRPDLVHAMRIPYEGIVAALALDGGPPLLVSVWGNDFTLFAARYARVGRLTREAMRRADALHTDCRRDLRLAVEWSFDGHKPAVVLPAGGGVRTDLLSPGEPAAETRTIAGVTPADRVVLNPRGLRAYVRTDVFFRAARLVLDQCPDALFVCPGMAGNPVPERWARELGIADRVRLLPDMPRERFLDLFRLAEVSVSPSVHDGTPMTLLEAMACGCFPVAGDIESVREWIDDGVNGRLVDPADARALAEALAQALDDGALRDRARARNVDLVRERADHAKVMAEAERFYDRILSGARAGEARPRACAES